ncbi:MAG TPA: pyruvate kinase [Saprospiraceae bacterium]|nr:pyruvate kinase [Saprospiraceae bacterium]HMQ85633.1 pyruvate kinase [Saprospiraceae bacterium]
MTKSEIKALTDNLLQVHQALIDCSEEYKSILDKIHPNYRYSAMNFIRYLKLRTFELRNIQSRLSMLGLSSIGHSERYVLANIENILYFLHIYQGLEFKGKYSIGQHPINFLESQNLLLNNTNRLFQTQNRKRNTNIMVTMPTEATDYQFVKNLVMHGMDVARINCSHDDVSVWKKIAINIRKASLEVNRPCSVYVDLSGPKLRTGQVEEKPHPKKSKKTVNYLTLFEGDHLHLYRSDIVGQNARRDENGKEIEPAKISCTIPSIFDDIKAGENIWFDDGNIGGRISSINEAYALIRITKASHKGSKLRAEKGINLPDSDLRLPALTEEDLSHLPFVIDYADIVGYSFVRKPSDVEQLQAELKKLNKPEIGLVLKIENKEAFSNLPALLLTAMRSPTIGVMIARGDLAVELGAERLSEVQEQIMWLCEAAFIPNIWATQVLETLAKEGIATRAEITDAAMSAQAECVMLNKGDFILDAIQTLSNILERMKDHHNKKKETLRMLKVARHFFEQG